MSLEDLKNETYLVETPICSWCGESGVIEVPAPGFFAYQLGAAIQDAFPDTPAPVREQLKTGYHPKCWTDMFGGGHNE
jgi:hypothetical protein